MSNNFPDVLINNRLLLHCETIAPRLIKYGHLINLSHFFRPIRLWLAIFIGMGSLTVPAISHNPLVLAVSNLRIAFVYNLDIYLMNSDGSNQSQLTAVEPGPSGHPTWSPDGQKIAFDAVVSDPPGSSSYNSEIFMININKREQIRLTYLSSNESFPTWSPNGKQIAFISDRDGNWEVYTVNVDGSNEIRLTDNQADDGLHGLTWSPNSDRLAFVSDRNSGFDEGSRHYEAEQIYVMNVEKAIQNRATEDAINLTQYINICSAGEFYWNPSWSINNELAFALSCGVNWDIYILEVDDALQAKSDLTPVNLTRTKPSEGVLGLDWSSDGSKIVFVSNPDATKPQKYEIFVMDVNASLKNGNLAVRQITNKPNLNTFYAYPVWEK